MWSTKYLSEGQVDLSRPFVWTLPQARRTLLFVDLSPSDDASMTKAFSLVSDAARRADNFGTDEMPTVEYLRWILATFADDVMAVYDVATSGKDSCSDSLMVGLLAVVPCRYVRSCHPINCSLIMVTAESISTHLVWRDLARLGCEIGRRGEKRYRGCTVDVFITCVELVAALREEGFFIVSYVPDAGLVSGFPGRHIASYVMYKELGIPSPLQLRSDPDSANTSDDDIPANVNLMEVPQLPIRHVLANGQSIIVRSLRNDEIRSYYEALKAAAASGAGYGVDELPDIGYFVRWYVTDCYNLVYEMCASSPEQLQDSDSSVDQAKDASSKDGDGTGVTRIIAYAGFSSSLYSRSLEHPILADSNIVLLPEFRNRHWSDDLLYILQSIVYAAGFRRIFGDTAMRNIPMLLFTSKMKGAATGSIPRGIFLKEFGWTDLMVGGYELRASLVEGQRKHRGHQALVSKI